MRPLGPDSLHSDCVLVVGISRPKLAAVLLSVMLFSLFLTFHVLYDSAVYSIQASISRSEPCSCQSICIIIVPSCQFAQTVSALPEHRIPTVSHRFALPRSSKSPPSQRPNSHRIHFPKTSRRLPQVCCWFKKIKND